MRAGTIETITLREILKAHWEVDDKTPDRKGVEVVNSTRRQELRLRRVLPSMLLRRLDRGFARSNTVHPETGNALYSLCRAVKPKNVFETGTYWGYSTAYLAAALRDGNYQGKVWTFDLYPHAGKYIPKSLRQYVELKRGRPSTETMPDVLQCVVPELIFQDSRHDYEGVSEELRILEPHMRQGATFLFHDFVETQVRRAATDVLAGYQFYVLDLPDPQQLGVAIKVEE